MESTRNTQVRSCPVCGARNSGVSLFCAECGSRLNSESWQDDGQTQAFQPATSSSSPAWASNDVTAAPRNSGNYDTGETAAVGVPLTNSGSADNAAAYSSGTMVSNWSTNNPGDDRGARGFALGFIAWFLILAVFGTYLWSSVFSSGLREDIRDLIPWLSVILFRFWPSA